MTENKIIRIGFLLFPGFPMACLTSIIEPLRAANEIGQQTAFQWRLLAEEPGRVMSSAEVGFDVDTALADAESLDLILILSGPAARFDDEKAGNGILRALERHGTALGGISGGVFPLVRSGVMAGQRVSVHWCYEAAFRAEFPEIEAADEVIVFGNRRYTVSGAAAAFDLALHLVEERLSEQTAQEVACWFQHPRMRGERVRQRVPVLKAPRSGDDLPVLVERSVALFAAHLSEPISVAEVARRMGVTPRQIERSFKKATAQSPTHYYRAMRMKAARQLVIYTRDRIADVAVAVGYASATPMIAHYRAAYGRTPAEDRLRANQFRVEENVPVPTV